jgi:hypothetical protein
LLDQEQQAETPKFRAAGGALIGSQQSYDGGSKTSRDVGAFVVLCSGTEQHE